MNKNPSSNDMCLPTYMKNTYEEIMKFHGITEYNKTDLWFIIYLRLFSFDDMMMMTTMSADEQA